MQPHIYILEFMTWSTHFGSRSRAPLGTISPDVGGLHRDDETTVETEKEDAGAKHADPKHAGPKHADQAEVLHMPTLLHTSIAY